MAALGLSNLDFELFQDIHIDRKRVQTCISSYKPPHACLYLRLLQTAGDTFFAADKASQFGTFYVLATGIP